MLENSYDVNNLLSSIDGLKKIFFSGFGVVQTPDSFPVVVRYDNYANMFEMRNISINFVRQLLIEQFNIKM